MAGAEPRCSVGDERALFPGLKKESVLLGCAELEDGREIDLLAEKGAGGLCLQLTGIDNQVRECGSAPSAEEPPGTEAVAPQAIARANSSAPLEVYGAISTNAAGVTLEYTARGSVQRRRAEVLQVTDEEALNRAGIRDPFGYFLAELPAETSKVRAIAVDSEGDRLGSAPFGGILQQHPRVFMAPP